MAMRIDFLIHCYFSKIPNKPHMPLGLCKIGCCHMLTLGASYRNTFILHFDNIHDVSCFNSFSRYVNNHFVYLA